MGYRSSWYLAINGDTAKKIKQKTMLGESLESISDLLGFCETTMEDDEIYMEAHGIKMYESYSEVAAFYTWLASLDEEDYKYYEIGEEDSDISSRGCNNELLQLDVSVARQ